MARPRILHIGDAIKYNPSQYAALASSFEIIQPSAPERERPEFIRALREGRWGDFAAIMRPFWLSGGEMGRWDEELISLLPSSVRVFASAGAGFDWADVGLLAERGIVYCNASPACAESVADFATAMIVAAFRQLSWCVGAAASGSAEAWRECHENATEDSHTLGGRVLGIVGLGSIGQRIARRCGAGFGMAIHYHDVERKPSDIEKESVRGLGEVVFHESLESLVRASDCVVLCAPPPLPSSSAPMMSTTQFSWFQPGARFVNVARGSMVDEEALADALEEGRISAAALDVHAHEPHVNERLQRMAAELPSKASQNKGRGRVMLSCHNGGGTLETYVGFEALAMANVAAVLGGDKPLTAVNLGLLKESKL